ncbi:MAG: FliM/FliN family flagellar motor switch protein [Halioglobus sp.]|nr:FliM/FliN family flagellar motor switch protein [Halioglobus sp.]
MSSKDVLTEGELDALMDGFSKGEVTADSQAHERECEPFDFSTREQNLLAQMPALKRLHEKHAMALSQGIQTLYRVAAQVDIGETQLLRFDKALGAIEGPAGINMVTIAPLNGLSFVVIPGELLSFLVDSYFGGGRSSPGAAPRERLTPSERRLNDVLTEKFLATLTDTWRDTIGFTPQVQSFESNPAFLQAGAPQSLALVFPFVVSVGEWSARIEWLVPYPALEPLRVKLSSAGSLAKPAPGGSSWKQHFLRALQYVDVEIVGSFISEQVSIADVLAFKPGSILPLKMPTEVTVCVENQVFSTGEHGVLNGHKSIKIKEIIRENSVH